MGKLLFQGFTDVFEIISDNEMKFEKKRKILKYHM